MLVSQRHRILKLNIGKRVVREYVAHVAAIKRAMGERAAAQKSATLAVVAEAVVTFVRGRN